MEDISMRLKEQAQIICTELSNFGEQSLFLSVKPDNQTSTFLGSTNGMVFLQSRMDIIEQFYKFCSGQQLSVEGLRLDASTMTDVSYKKAEPRNTQEKAVMTEKFPETCIGGDSISSDIRSDTNRNSRESINSENMNRDNSTTVDSIIQDDDNSSPDNSELLDNVRLLEDNNTGAKNVNNIDEKKEEKDEDAEENLTEVLVKDEENSEETSENEPVLWKDRLNRNRKPSAVILETEGRFGNTKTKTPKTATIPLEERTFDIYISGKRVYQAVHEVANGVGPPAEDKNEKFKIEGSKETGYVVNFEDIKLENIEPIKLTSKRLKLREFKSTKTSETVYEQADGGWKCSYCGKICRTKTWLKRHMLMHTGERPLKCKICGKTYKQYGHLSKHMISHNPTHRPHVCEICGKTFSYLDSLKSHKKLHQDLPPCKCPDCGKTFARIELLKQHLAFKASGYDFMCEVCGHAFRQKDTLRKHQLTHQEDRPEYSCPHCDKKFFRKDNFKAHVNNHLGIHKYVCECCNMVFSSANTLSRHRRRKAGLLGKKSKKSEKKHNIIEIPDNKLVEQQDNVQKKFTIISGANIQQLIESAEVFPVTSDNEVIYVIEASALSEENSLSC